MKTKPDFKFGDQVVLIGNRQKRGVVSRVFRSGVFGGSHFKANQTGDTTRVVSSGGIRGASSYRYGRPLGDRRSFTRIRW